MAGVKRVIQATGYWTICLQARRGSQVLLPRRWGAYLDRLTGATISAFVCIPRCGDFARRVSQQRAGGRVAGWLAAAGAPKACAARCAGVAWGQRTVGPAASANIDPALPLRAGPRGVRGFWPGSRFAVIADVDWAGFFLLIHGPLLSLSAPAQVDRLIGWQAWHR